MAEEVIAGNLGGDPQVKPGPLLTALTAAVVRQRDGVDPGLQALVAAMFRN